MFVLCAPHRTAPKKTSTSQTRIHERKQTRNATPARLFEPSLLLTRLEQKGFRVASTVLSGFLRRPLPQKLPFLVPLPLLSRLRSWHGTRLALCVYCHPKPNVCHNKRLDQVFLVSKTLKIKV